MNKNKNEAFEDRVDSLKDSVRGLADIGSDRAGDFRERIADVKDHAVLAAETYLAKTKRFIAGEPARLGRHRVRRRLHPDAPRAAVSAMDNNPALDAVARRIREHPLRSIAIAALAGAWLGYESPRRGIVMGLLRMLVLSELRTFVDAMPAISNGRTTSPGLGSPRTVSFG